LEFDEEGFAVCEESGDKYRILDNVVFKAE
jgi:hypothetical protein